MKIISLQAENVKKLKAVEIKPTGEIVTIAGKNGQGKTSILDSIWWALRGTSNIQAQPIRRGEKKARIRLDLGELIVERKFVEGGSTLIVESTEGARFPSPQKMLDALIGELSFDPLAFARMDPRKQFDELRRVSKLEVDIDALNRLNASDFAKRTDINRDAKTKRAQAEGVTVPPKVEGEALDESALVDELQRAGETNAELAQRVARREKAATELETLRGLASEKKARADALRRQADDVDVEVKSIQASVDDLSAKLASAPALPIPINVSELRAKVEAARTRNGDIAAYNWAAERKATLNSEAEALEKRAHEITEAMRARDAVKADGIKNAKMPIEGIGFGTDGVTFDGIPFEQASSAEQLRVSMAIAMAANPKLRVIRITDGSLLDHGSMEAIAEMARLGDYQIWVERVDDTGKVGIVIEDGAVVAVNEEATP